MTDTAGGRNPYTFMLTLTLLIGLFLGALLVSNLSSPSDAVEGSDIVEDVSPTGEDGNLPVSEQTLKKLVDYLPTEWLLSKLGQSEMLENKPLDIGDDTRITEGSSPLSIGNMTDLSGKNSFTQPRDTLHFTVEADQPAYWRLTAYDAYQGDGWERSAGQRDRTIPKQNQRSQQTVTVTYESSMKGIPSPWRPVDTDRPDEQISYDVENGMRSDQINQKGDQVTVTSIRPIDDPDRLQTAVRDYPDRIQERYTKLPADVPTRVSSRTDAITDASTTPYEKARRIEQWLRSNYNYSLDIPAGSGQITDDLLFERDEAYCAYFATAMTVMLRTQDIPARYVTGYNTGTYNETKDAYDVKSMHAHAWVEVYFPELGWVPFEPTPPASREAAIEEATGEEDGAKESDTSQSEKDEPEDTNATKEPEEPPVFAISSITMNATGDTARSDAVVDIDATMSTGKTQSVELLDTFGTPVSMQWDQGVYTTETTPAALGCDSGDRLPCQLTVRASNGTSTVTNETILYVDDVAPTITDITLNTTTPVVNTSVGVSVDIDGENSTTIETVSAWQEGQSFGHELEWNGDKWTGAVFVRNDGRISVKADDIAANSAQSTSASFTVQQPSSDSIFERYKSLIVALLAVVGVLGVVAWRKGWLTRENLRYVLNMIFNTVRRLPDIFAHFIVGMTRAGVHLGRKVLRAFLYMVRQPRSAVSMVRDQFLRWLQTVRSHLKMVRDDGAVTALKRQMGVIEETYDDELLYAWALMRDASPLDPVSHYTPSEIGASVTDTTDMPDKGVEKVVEAFHRSSYSSHPVDIDRQTLDQLTERLEAARDGNDS